MNIFDSKERKVVCTKKYDTSPYSCPYELLEIGKEYTMTDIDVGGWVSYVTLKEFPNKSFNSVLFEECDTDE